MTLKIDLVGLKFGRFTVIRSNGHIGSSIAWECICDCGTVRTVNGAMLRQGRSQSCGCRQRELAAAQMTTHGHAPNGNVTPGYHSYRMMLKRCTDPKRRDFKHYGGRGITVCERWVESFTYFLEDMGPMPKGLQLDRIDNSKGYSKENCRWATRIANANNKRNNVFITYNGETKTMAEWSRLTNIPTYVIRKRLKAQWTFERIISEPVGTKTKDRR